MKLQLIIIQLFEDDPKYDFRKPSVGFPFRIRTDNGTEFVNQTLREYYEKVGISHETSVARSPQQNELEVIAPIPKAVAPEHVVSTGSPSSTTVDQDAPSPSNSHTTQETQTPIISHDVEEDNHDIEVAHIGNDPYFGIPIPEVTHDQSSSSDVIHIIVPPTPVSEHNRQNETKDHATEEYSEEIKHFMVSHRVTPRKRCGSMAGCQVTRRSTSGHYTTFGGDRTLPLDEITTYLTNGFDSNKIPNVLDNKKPIAYDCHNVSTFRSKHIDIQVSLHQGASLGRRKIEFLSQAGNGRKSLRAGVHLRQLSDEVDE
ncbi:retrovirus-related pol polyprotein from transposon TNT 1-94 [Tanacetum coccineum]